MELENTENTSSAETETDDAAVDAQNELNEARWSVVSFETCVAHGLAYEQAANKLTELLKAKVSGLCIITDEAARRITN